MRQLVAILIVLTAASAMGADRVPVEPRATQRGSKEMDPAWRFGTAVEGNRIGLCCEGAIFGLGHLPDIVGTFEVGKPPNPATYVPPPLGSMFVAPNSFLILTHPDGSVSREAVGWSDVGDGSWEAGLGHILYRAVQGPGIYKVQFKAAAMESPSISFTVVPESRDFVADPRLDKQEALRKARGAAEKMIRADASKYGYEPIFTYFNISHDDTNETLVMFAKMFNDGSKEKPGGGIVAYNKVTGAVRWVPYE